MKKNGFIKGAMLLIIFNMIGKVIGAVYRIPLANIVGGVGMGKYQLVFPLYCLILTISTSGIPVAISKLVAEYNSQNRFSDSNRLLKVSILFLTLISLLGSVVVFFLAKPIARFQGNADNYICFYGIAPAILFVGVLSAFRGYFQGNLLMFPTAFSGFIEQIFKLIFGLVFASKLAVYGVEYAVLGALAGITVSEFAAFIFLLISYFVFSLKRGKPRQEVSLFTYKNLVKNLIGISVPITLGGLISPITALVDSMLVVNLLMTIGFTSSAATAMLGIESGVVEPLINLPVAIAISLSTVLLPNLSGLNANKQYDKMKSLIEKTYQICLSISVTCAICFVIFGNQILTFLYGRSFSPDEIYLATKLLIASSINIVFLSLVQITAGTLQSMGHQNYPVRSLLFGCLVKIALDVTLLLIRQINILGTVISGGICYFIVLLLNYRKVKLLTQAKLSKSFYYISIQAFFVSMFAFFSNMLFKMVFSDIIALFVAGILVGLIFLSTFYVFFFGKQKDFEFENKTN